jgi:hypothetical protein
MKDETRPDDGVEYWAYIMIYVDNIVCVHHNPGTSLTQFYKYFKMNPCSIMELRKSMHRRACAHGRA